MLNRLPTGPQLPSLAVILDDLGQPHPRKLARALGVTERTVRRWRASNRAPRSAVLALFWLTRWGRSALDCELANAVQLHAALARSLQRELHASRRELARLASLRFGAANDATQSVAPTLRLVTPQPRCAATPGPRLIDPSPAAPCPLPDAPQPHRPGLV